MAALTREQILAADDIKIERVQVWGGELCVQTMRGCDRDELEAHVGDTSKPRAQRLANFRARMVSLCAVDEQGTRLFTEADVEILGRKSASELDRVVEVAQRVNKLTDEHVEAAVKN